MFYSIKSHVIHEHYWFSSWIFEPLPANDWTAGQEVREVVMSTENAQLNYIFLIVLKNKNKMCRLIKIYIKTAIYIYTHTYIIRYMYSNVFSKAISIYGITVKKESQQEFKSVATLFPTNEWTPLAPAQSNSSSSFTWSQRSHFVLNGSASAFFTKPE